MTERRARAAKWVDAAEAVRHIERGRRILVGSGCAEPQHLVKALIDQADRFRDNEIVHLLTFGIAPYAAAEYQRSFRHNAFFIGPNVRRSVAEGLSDYTPIFLSEIPHLFRSGHTPIHAALIQVAPPEADDTVSLGVSVDIVRQAALCADVVIAQVNRQMPRTRGPMAKLALSDIDFLVPMDEPILEMPRGEMDDVSRRIGRRVAKLIKDGDTLQLGIGNIPNAILLELREKSDLGIHTEMFSDGFIELYRNGNITNRKKGFHDGVSMTSFVLGSRALYDVIDDNEDIHFYPSDYINDPFNIAQNSNMVSVNSAIEVDLTGQVCADSLGSRFFSGIGGQVDFVRGARRSPGGRSVIALPATAKGGSLSRIVPTLHEGAGVVTSRGDVEYVVTEYGVAYLHGMTVRERAIALAQIAHPDFRQELLDALKQRRYVFVDQALALNDDAPLKKLIPAENRFGDTMVYFRDLKPSDERFLKSFFYSHSEETIHQRYYHDVNELPREAAQRAVLVDYERDMALAGYDSDKPYAGMICVGRFISNKENDAAVIAIVVKESYRGKGIATFLMGKLIEAAKARKLNRLYAFALAHNETMIDLLERSGFKADPDTGPHLLCYIRRLEGEG